MKALARAKCREEDKPTSQGVSKTWVLKFWNEHDKRRRGREEKSEGTSSQQQQLEKEQLGAIGEGVGDRQDDGSCVTDRRTSNGKEARVGTQTAAAGARIQSAVTARNTHTCSNLSAGDQAEAMQRLVAVLSHKTCPPGREGSPAKDGVVPLETTGQPEIQDTLSTESAPHCAKQKQVRFQSRVEMVRLGSPTPPPSPNTAPRVLQVSPTRRSDRSSQPWSEGDSPLARHHQWDLGDSSHVSPASRHLYISTAPPAADPFCPSPESPRNEEKPKRAFIQVSGPDSDTCRETAEEDVGRGGGGGGNEAQIRFAAKMISALKQELAEGHARLDTCQKTLAGAAAEACAWREHAAFVATEWKRRACSGKAGNGAGGSNKGDRGLGAGESQGGSVDRDRPQVATLDSRSETLRRAGVLDVGDGDSADSSKSRPESSCGIGLRLVEVQGANDESRGSPVTAAGRGVNACLCACPCLTVNNTSLMSVF